MMTKYEKINEAVSPVVGVMLMLVVTIVIAAVVSGFAGSMTGSISTTPQVTLDATYSQSGGMTITHAGGDSLPLSEVTFATMPSELMGIDYLQFLYDIDPSVLNYTNSDGESTAIMSNVSGYYYKAAFIPGDVLTISQADCTDRATTDEMLAALNAASSGSPYYTGGSVNLLSQLNWPQGSDTGYDSDKGRYFVGYEFMNPDNKGKYFYLTVRDSAETTIAKVKVQITA
ncbi:type IV pilin N-terminal domain-containing protein [Methanolacinia petrolearia]|uniref:type IV pilin N-terminal domain-containing protein n=1 Tax=Methanolacinia petrolearia TaxID=54120 RepID=UPI003BA90160